MSTGASDTVLFGVNLSDTAKETSTNLGVCVVSGHDIKKLTVTQVRECIQQQLTTCPPKFVICTKQGWQVNQSQEDKLTLNQILTEDGCVLIQIGYDCPKIGVRDNTGSVIGFVFVPYNSDLQKLKEQIIQEILKPQGLAETFQLLEGNQWPISTSQESHMTVSEVLIGSCVHTSINSITNSTHNISPSGPPLKKHKGVKELSFNSSKDVCRLPPTNGSLPTSHAKQILISYVSVESASNALHLKEELAALGFSVYLDVHEIQSGIDWQDSLNFAVSECEVFVPLVTQKYGETLWTNREVKLADVLGKYILPVNFLDEWPPRCLAIQFATTQFIPWKPQVNNQNKTSRAVISEWTSEDVKKVTMRIADRIGQLSVTSTPSLVKRATIVKSCPCVNEDNQLAITSDREGKPLIMICLHPDQESYATDLKRLFEKEPFEVWCTTELDKNHLAYLDGLACSQEGESYSSVVQNNRLDNQYLRSVQTFQEKADDASVVLFVLSQAFSKSRTCQQQVFYCEHRKRVIPILYEEFQMPCWMTMLIGSSGLESIKDEHFGSIIVQRIKMLTDPGHRLKRALSIQNQSPTRLKRKISTSYDDVDSGVNVSPAKDETSPILKRPSLSAMKTVLL